MTKFDPLEDEKEKWPVVKGYFDGVMQGERPAKPQSATAAATVDLVFQGWDSVKSQGERQKKATEASTEIRKNKKTAREDKWRERTKALLEKYPDLKTKNIVTQIQEEGHSQTNRTISKVVAPIVKVHRKSWLGNR